MAKTSILECIVLCKNKQTAKTLFERYLDLLDMNNFKCLVDRVHLIVQDRTSSTRFLSVSQYYRIVCHGQHDVRTVGDEGFARAMDEYKKSRFPSKKECD